MGAPLVPFVATVTASAEEPGFPAWGAAVHDESKHWCVANGVGASLTLTFDRAIPLGVVSLLTDYESGKYVGPAKIQLAVDGKTVDAEIGASNDFLDVRLDKPTKQLTLKIASVKAGKTQRTCVREIYVTDTRQHRLPVLVNGTPAAATALQPFVRALDAGMHACDGKAIAAGFTFPLAATTYIAAEPRMDQEPTPPVDITYKSAAELAAACAKDGSLIPLGYSGDLDEGLEMLTTPAPGTAVLGDLYGAGWKLVWSNGWKVTQIGIQEPNSALAFQTSDARGLGDWLGQGLPAGWSFAAGAKAVILGPKDAVIDPAQAEQLLAKVSGKTAVDTATTSRDGQTIWFVQTVKAGKAERRATSLAVRTDAGWQLIAAMVSDARPNADVNKAAAAGKSPALAPLPKLTGPKDLLDAVAALATGPIDPLAASRKDLVAIGSGPGEVTTGGAKLAGPWKAAWTNKVVFGGGVATVAPSGRTAFVAVDATLDKGKYKIPFRVGLVLDKNAAGAWSLVHAHLATP